jgi:hypothetical protein
MTKVAGSGSESGFISQRHGFADPDPDPQQNVMDPQPWKAEWKQVQKVRCEFFTIKDDTYTVK